MHYLNKNTEIENVKKCVYTGKSGTGIDGIAVSSSLFNDGLMTGATTVKIPQSAMLVSVEDEFNKKIIDIFENLASNDIMLGLHIRSNLDELKKLQQDIAEARNLQAFRR